MSAIWIVAASPKEADDLVADGFGLESKSAAEQVLSEIKRTADPFYSSKLKVYKRREVET